MSTEYDIRRDAVAGGPPPGAVGAPPTDPAARWRRVREIFDAVADVPPAEREALLGQLTADTPALAGEVRALLAADARPAPALDATPAVDRATTRPVAAPPPREPPRPEGRARFTEAATRQGAALVGARIGGWRLEAVVGHGGMGTVFRAVDAAGRTTALKRLDAPPQDEAAAARFAREVRLGARLRHPHLLHVFEALRDASGVAWLAMPLVTGETLRARLDRERRLPLPEAVRIARALVDALVTLHDAGIVHRDLKPENVLLADAPVEGVALPAGGAPTSARPQPLVADFGIARALDVLADERLTASGFVLGTPTYMSPEQLRGERADARADVWALGVVLHEMLTGEPPWRGAALRALLFGTGDALPPLGARLPGCPPALEALVAAMLAPAPAARSADAARVRDALDAIAATPSTG